MPQCHQTERSKWLLGHAPVPPAIRQPCLRSEAACHQMKNKNAPTPWKTNKSPGPGPERWLVRWRWGGQLKTTSPGDGWVVGGVEAREPAQTTRIWTQHLTHIFKAEIVQKQFGLFGLPGSVFTRSIVFCFVGALVDGIALDGRSRNSIG